MRTQEILVIGEDLAALPTTRNADVELLLVDCGQRTRRSDDQHIIHCLPLGGVGNIEDADQLFAVMPARMTETGVAVVYVMHICNALSVPCQPCFPLQIAVSVSSVKTVSFNEVKRQEAQSRLAAMRRARRSPAAAAAQQRRASLIGDGAKWRITNFKQVARAMSKWA